MVFNERGILIKYSPKRNLFNFSVTITVRCNALRLSKKNYIYNIYK